MKKKNLFASRKLTVILLCVALALAACLLWLLLHMDKPEQTSPAPETAQPTLQPTEAPSTVPPETEATEPTIPQPTEPVVLPELAEDYEKNPDMCGWIQIEGTQVDYPLMYTPEEPEKYLRMNFDGNYSVGGLPFLDADCSLEPESDNLIIYGHNMLDGSQFRTIMMYNDESYWQEHPTIKLSTLYEQREYEVLAAFYDRVYYKYEECFKFYQFIDAEDEAAFNEAIAYYKEHSEYDTGVTAEYGDRLITLVTCSYHHDYGRFVVVAREAAGE